MTERQADLLQGTLDLLILKILALGPHHGWGVSQRIQQMGKGLRFHQDEYMEIVGVGAHREQVLWLSLRGGIRIAVLGLILGIGGSLVATRLMRSLLYLARIPTVASGLPRAL